MRHDHNTNWFSLFSLLSLFAGMLLLTSCGGSGSTTKSIQPPPVVPTITMQPTSQTMLMGRSATFTVAASGTAPLLYQWYRNGVAVSNGNAASFITPTVTAADNNTTYSVTISNSDGSVKSTVATLLTGPRAPAIGDLRYLQWEQVPLMADIGSRYGGLLNLIGIESVTESNAVAYPLNVGSYSVSSPNLPCA